MSSEPKARTRRQIGYFLVIGVAGLIVDLTCYAGLNQLTNDMAARAGSIAIAVTATWLLNRFLTFKRLQFKHPLREYFEYVLASLFAAILNYGSFIFMNGLVQPFALSDYLFICISSAFAAIVNFTLYKYLVFKDKEAPKAHG